MGLGHRSWYSARKISTAFWLVFVAIAALQCVAYYHQFRREAENDRQEEAQRVLADTQQLLLNLGNEQAGEEGYVVTGNPLELEMYQGAVARCRSQLQAIRRAVEIHYDSRALPELDAALDRLKLAEAEVASVVQLRQQAGFDAAAARLRTGASFTLLQQVRADLERLQAEQATTLSQRTAREQQSIRNNLRIFMALTAADLGLLAIGYWGINRYSQERQRAEAALSEAWRAAESEHAAAVAANQTKDRILQTVSHDLRTPLSGILMWGQLLARHQSPDVQEAAASIVRSAEDQTRLVNDLLDASRMQRGALRVEMHPVPLATAVCAAGAAIAPVAEAKGVAFVLDLDPAEKAIVLGDRLRLQQVFWNLFTNAVKFTPAGGRVHVQTRHLAGAVEVLVRDTGKGISETFLPHLFDAFSQDTATAEGRNEGLGLGMAIVKHLVELHGGTVTASSDGIGRGATVCVRLPLSRESIPTPQAEHVAGF